MSTPPDIKPRSRDVTDGMDVRRIGPCFALLA